MRRQTRRKGMTKPSGSPSSRPRRTRGSCDAAPVQRCFLPPRIPRRAPGSVASREPGRRLARSSTIWRRTGARRGEGQTPARLRAGTVEPTPMSTPTKQRTTRVGKRGARRRLGTCSRTRQRRRRRRLRNPRRSPTPWTQGTATRSGGATDARLGPSASRLPTQRCHRYPPRHHGERPRPPCPPAPLLRRPHRLRRPHQRHRIHRHHRHPHPLRRPRPPHCLRPRCRLRPVDAPAGAPAHRPWRATGASSVPCPASRATPGVPPSSPLRPE